jgi:polar amino acid transport system permease protein
MPWYSLLFGPDGWWGLLLKGAMVTLALALTTLPIGLTGGLALAVMKLSSSRPIRGACNIYTTFFRGIPDLLALFIIYFGLQALLNKLGPALGVGKIEISAFTAGVVALSAVVAAYSSEVWVTSIAAVPPGQAEAAKSVGLRSRQIFFLVTCPQMLRIALPGLGNIWMVLLKDTALISTLAVTDLLRAAAEGSRATTRPLVFYTAAAAIYLIISIISGMMQSAIEKRANQGYA